MAEAEGAVVPLPGPPPKSHATKIAAKPPPKDRGADITAMAEAEGFEPSMGFKTQTRLAGGRHRPD